MVAISSQQSLADANIDSLERLAVALGLFFAQKTGTLPNTSPSFEAITFQVRERAGTDPNDPAATLITSTIEFECYFPLQSDTRLEAGLLLQNIEPFLTLDAPSLPTTPASLLSAPAIPAIPPELTNSEQLMVWALLVLNASAYPENQDYIQIAPAYEDSELKISFQFPLDSEALSLNSYQLIGASKRIVDQYLALDTGAVSQIGLDAYDVAVTEGFLGTRAEWLASLIGPAGPAGPAGADGADGAPGQDGADYYQTTTTKTTTYSAISGEAVLCDTTGGAFTVSLPVTGRVRIIDVGGTSYTTGFGQHNLTLAPQPGDTIAGETNLVLDVGLTSITLVYISGNWVVTDLDGAAFTTEVTTNADWNAVSGDSQILNKPTLGTAAATDSTDYATAAQGALADTALQPDQAETISGNYTFNGALILPNNSRINGVEHFYQTTKPTVRGDSSALVAGDRWWKTDDGTEWFWNGTYWLSPVIFIALPNTLTTDSLPEKVFTATGSGPSHSMPTIGANAGLFVSSANVNTLLSSADGSNYWDFTIYARSTVAGPITLVTIRFKSNISNTTTQHSIATYVEDAGNLSGRLYLSAVKVGTPGNLSVRTNINCHVVYS